MITTYPITFAIILYVSLIILVTDILVEKLRFKEINFKQSVIGHRYHKFIYTLRNTRINKTFFIKFLLQAISYLVLFMPILFYSKDIYGNKIAVLISSIQERDFLFIWACFSSISFLNLKTFSLIQYKQDLRVLVTNLIYLCSVFIIISIENKLSISSYDINGSLITIIVIAIIILLTRYVFLKNLIEVDEKNSGLQEIKKINQRVYLFSLTTLSSATIIKIVSLHIDLNILNILPLMLSTLMYFLLSFERKIWSNIDIFQREYLENKYQFPLQFLFLGFLCCIYFYH